MTGHAWLRRANGPALAYHRVEGRGPGVVFLGGYMSHMGGTKATELDRRCRESGRACLRFDFRGHGRSEGRFEDATIGGWIEDALAALDGLTQGPQVLVGSSMGAWIMLRVALARPGRVCGLVGIAAAPDFTEESMIPALSAPERQQLETTGEIRRPGAYGPEPFIVTRKLLEEAREHLLLRGAIPLDRPVRLVHGQQDPDIPWQTSLRLAERLTAADVRITLIKDGDHRLSRDRDLKLIWQQVSDLAGG